MPRSNHSTVSDAYVSSISGVSGNFGGRKPFDRTMPVKDIRKWADEHYPPLPTEDTYVSQYTKPQKYREGTPEYKDHKKYDTISLQAKKTWRGYEDDRYDVQYIATDYAGSYQHNLLRKRTGTLDGTGLDYHKLLEPRAARSSDAWERSARNRDKFQQKHPNVLWDVPSYEGHRNQALDEYTNCSRREFDRREHSDRVRGGYYDKRDELKADYRSSGRANDLEDALKRMQIKRDEDYYGRDRDRYR